LLVTVPVPPVLTVMEPVPVFMAPLSAMLPPSVPAENPPNRLPLLMITEFPAVALADVIDTAPLVPPVPVIAPAVTPFPIMVTEPEDPGWGLVELVVTEPSNIEPVANAEKFPPEAPAKLVLVSIFKGPLPADRLMLPVPAGVVTSVKAPLAGPPARLP